MKIDEGMECASRLRPPPKVPTYADGNIDIMVLAENRPCTSCEGVPDVHHRPHDITQPGGRRTSRVDRHRRVVRGVLAVARITGKSCAASVSAYTQDGDDVLCWVSHSVNRGPRLRERLDSC